MCDNNSIIIIYKQKKIVPHPTLEKWYYLIFVFILIGRWRSWVGAVGVLSKILIMFFIIQIEWTITKWAYKPLEPPNKKVVYYVGCQFFLSVKRVVHDQMSSQILGQKKMQKSILNPHPNHALHDSINWAVPKWIHIYWDTDTHSIPILKPNGTQCRMPIQWVRPRARVEVFAATNGRQCQMGPLSLPKLRNSKAKFFFNSIPS